MGKDILQVVKRAYAVRLGRLDQSALNGESLGAVWMSGKEIILAPNSDGSDGVFADLVAGTKLGMQQIIAQAVPLLAGVGECSPQEGFRRDVGKLLRNVGAYCINNRTDNFLPLLEEDVIGQGFIPKYLLLIIDFADLFQNMLCNVDRKDKLTHLEADRKDKLTQGEGGREVESER